MDRRDMGQARSLFDMPEEIRYFNAAYMGPRLKAVTAAGLSGLEQGAHPWAVKPQDFFTGVEEARALFAQLIGMSPDCVALMPSVSYGIETAARNLPLDRHEAILVLEDQFPSNVYPWRRRARNVGADIVTVPRPANGDWTAAVLDAMDDRIAIAALPHAHWTDGSLLDLAAISGACHAHGTALVLDVTQSLGAVPLNLGAVKPDFLVAAAYKWLLGPYNLAFCYIAPQHHGGEPLEENWISRAQSEDFNALTNYRDAYQPGARRFDMGERNNPVAIPMAIAALRQLLEWRPASIAESLSRIVERLANAGAASGFEPTPGAVRAPHMLGLRASDGAARLAEHLAREKIFISLRGGVIRISPHMHNTEEDVACLEEAIAKIA